MPELRDIFRQKVLRKFGANDSAVAELLLYNRNRFDHRELAKIELPVADEPFIPEWESYLRQADQTGIFQTLKSCLIQLQFSVREGISQTEPYIAATRRGEFPKEAMDGGVELIDPDGLELIIYPTLAGKIPILYPTKRQDFINLVQALTRKNEPVPIPDSMGAQMVAGYNNWNRIRKYREGWLINNPGMLWEKEFQRIIPCKELYQDCFIILSDSNYSGVSAKELGLSEGSWREMSRIIRRAHECTHYLTRRLLKSMQNNILDELIADYAGIMAATGRYHGDWSLHFLGLEEFPKFRAGGRLANYRGNPPLSEEAFLVLQKLTWAAVKNLEAFPIEFIWKPETMDSFRVLIALSYLTIEELAAPEMSQIMKQKLSTIAM